MYKHHRFLPEKIQYAVWLYHRFNLSNRDIEDLLAHRGIYVSYKAIRLWCIKFGLKYAQRLSQLQGVTLTLPPHRLQTELSTRMRPI
jgi:putative transposase